MRKQTNTLSLSPKGFQSPKFSDSDFREVRGRPKSSGKYPIRDHCSIVTVLPLARDSHFFTIQTTKNSLSPRNIFIIPYAKVPQGIEVFFILKVIFLLPQV
jgi:hypothetical protein